MADESIEQSGESGGIGSWWTETRSELRRVVWPSRDEAFNLTRAVLFVTALMVVILGGADYFYTKLIDVLVSLVSGT